MKNKMRSAKCEVRRGKWGDVTKSQTRTGESRTHDIYENIRSHMENHLPAVILNIHFLIESDI